MVKRKYVIKVVWVFMAVLASALMAVQPAAATLANSWNPGDEKKILGHTFEEEMFTAEVSNTTKDGAEVTFTVSYLNFNEVQAFLIAFKQWEKNGTRSTLPYQLFGMHYYTPGGREIFIGAVLAFLMAYNNTYNPEAGVPDPGNENVFYVIPFGVGDVLKNGSYVPEVENIPAQKISDGHYMFGMRYKNLYAKIIDGNTALGMILSTALPLYIAKFSELEIRYDIYIDKDAGTCRAETHYTIGQVDKLWLWGKEVPRDKLPDTMGIAAVHYLAVFASNFKWAGNTTGKQYAANMAGEIDENLTMKIGNDEEKALYIGFGSDYDVIDEESDTTLSNDTARNMLVKPTGADKLLVGWQAALSKDLFVTMAYALSKQVQKTYKSPANFGKLGWLTFTGTGMWYGVAFPKWEGYRIYHDPTYTGYFGDVPQDKPAQKVPGFTAIPTLVAIASTGIIWVAATQRKRRR